MNIKDIETEPVTKEFIAKYKKMNFYEKQNIWFLIEGNSTLSGSIMRGTYPLSDSLSFKNPVSGRETCIKWNKLKIVPNYRGEEVIGPNADKNVKNNSVKEHTDKYEGVVKIDSLVAYIDQTKARHEALQIGFVTAISKSGTVAVKNILDGGEIKLTNSKRHFVIDETILERLMVLKLARQSGD